MRCWFHDWTLWSKPYHRGNVFRYEYQQRRCTKCGMVKERLI